MSFGVVVYATVLISFATYCWLFNVAVHPVATLFITVLVLLAWVSYLGYLPRTITSGVARFLRLPKEVTHLFGAKRPFNYNVIDDFIIVGRLPRDVADYEHLIRKFRILAVVDCTETWEHLVPISAVRAATNLDILNIRTPDYAAVDWEDLLKAMEFIRQYASGGHRVYVHCNGGKGRAATIATAWLMLRERLDLKSALKAVKSKRNITNLAKFGGLLPVWHLLQRYERFLLSKDA